MSVCITGQPIICCVSWQRLRNAAEMPSLWQYATMLSPHGTDLTFGTRKLANQKGQRSYSRSHDPVSHHMICYFMHTSALSSTSSLKTASGSITWVGVASDDGGGSPSICIKKWRQSFIYSFLAGEGDWGGQGGNSWILKGRGALYYSNLPVEDTWD